MAVIMKEILKRDKNMVMVSMFGLMGVHILAPGSIIILVALGPTNGQMVEVMRVVGKITRCMGKESIIGQMADVMMVFTMRI